MPLDFGHHKSSNRPRRRPPPNYLSRRVQWKIFFLVAALMLVLVMMREARNPENWRWMWQLDKRFGSAMGGPETRVDTRLRRARTPGAPSDGPVIVADPPKRRAPARDPSPEMPAPSTEMPTSGERQRDGEHPARSRRTATLIDQTRREAWKRLLHRLRDDDRQLFLKALKAARDRVALPEPQRRPWTTIVARLDQGWQEYLNEALVAADQDTTRLGDDERAAWREVIESLRTEWNDGAKPALELLGGAVPPDRTSCEHLDAIQRVLDGIFLESVEDNTVFRSAEKDAWFRLFEELEWRDESELCRASLGRVTFLQLYRQSAAYRGKLVTVTGEVRLGYHRQAPRNLYGITSYYIFWLKPPRADSPIVVYSLEVPPGFPDVRAMEAQGKQPMLSEPVEFTGFFFKRWAYRAKDGTRLAPLVLAKIPRWTDRSELARMARAATERPGPLYWIALVGGTALFGIVFAVIVARIGRRSIPVAELPRELEFPKELTAKE